MNSRMRWNSRVRLTSAAPTCEPVSRADASFADAELARGMAAKRREDPNVWYLVGELRNAGWDTAFVNRWSALLFLAGGGVIVLLGLRRLAPDETWPTTSYTSWQDVVSTVQAIIAAEAAGRAERDVIVYAPEWEVRLMAGDHSDRIATGELARAASWGHAWNHAWYLAYRNLIESPNLTAEQYAAKWATVAQRGAAGGGQGARKWPLERRG